ncbi:MAG TPA: hypothetical protein VF041_23055 [Gemmatimonadaceae bacterium]
MAKKGAKPNAKAPLGQGGRFAAIKAQAMAEGKSAEQAAAIAAAAGMKAHGKAAMQKMAQAGKKKKSAR